MKARLANLWDSLSRSFWFVPALMIILAIGLSVATVELDVLHALSASADDQQRIVTAVRQSR
jgi:uncharacterized membrane protein